MPRWPTTRVVAACLWVAASACRREGANASSDGDAVPSQGADAPASAPASELEPESEGACREHPLPWTQPGCCPSNDGLTPSAIVQACQFDAYLGQAKDWGCAHSFRAGEATHTFRVTSLHPLDLAQAIALRRSAFFPNDPATELGPIPALAGSDALAHGDWAWAFVPRGDAPLRLSWPIAACSLEALTPTLQAMSRSTHKPDPQPIATIVAGAKASATQAREGSLLALYAERDRVEPDEHADYVLPYKCKRMAVALLIATAQHDHAALAGFLTPHARYGLPDRRELGARAVFAGDDGRAFMAHLRPTLQRLSGEARFVARPLVAEQQALVADGQAPMWVYFQDAKDVLVMRMIGPSGAAKIDYVGYWPSGPDERLDTTSEGPPPPQRPPFIREGRIIVDDVDVGPAPADPATP